MDALAVKRGTSPAERVKAELLHRIRTGQYPPASLLPSQRELAGEFSVDRAHIRRALRELEAAGVVKGRHGRGTQVLPGVKRPRPAKIGLLHPRGESWFTPEASLLYAGMTDRLGSLGYRWDRICVVYGKNAGLGAARPERSVKPDQVGALTERYDAMLFLECSQPGCWQAVRDLERRRYPVVVANLEGDLPGVSGTTVDHAAVTRWAVSILASYGHRRIALVSRSPDNLFYGQALEGYREGLAAEGLPQDQSLMALADTADALSGYLAVKPLFERSEPPTAIIAARDILAEGVCQAAEEAGLAVGYDLSIIGFDNVSWEGGRSFLTTFKEPCHELGAVAVDMLAERLVHGWRPVEQRVLDTPLILRRSAGPVPREARVDGGEVDRQIRHDVRVRMLSPSVEVPEVRETPAVDAAPVSAVPT